MARTAASGIADRAAYRPIINHLIIAREAAGIPRTVLAARMGCQYTQLANWENHDGLPGPHWLTMWAAQLGYDVALVPKDPPDPPELTR